MRKQNIILIMADDFGYECIAANGGRSYNTPNFDAMAQNGVRFSQCFGQPVCTPSRVQIMTGKYNDKNYEAFGYLPVGERTFGNLFRDHGYRTCISGKWQLNGISKYPGGKTDRKRYEHFGFEESCLWQMTETRAAGERFADPLIDTNGEDLRVHEGEYGPDIFCDFGLEFIERHKDEPFFWYYPMVLTHAPFFPTPHSDCWANGDRENEDTKYFRDMVEYTDHLVGKVIRRVEELGLAEDTLILFTGDNGTSRRIVSEMADIGEYPGGKGYTYTPGTHVPLLAVYGNRIQRGAACESLVDFSDFLPTLAEVADLPLDRYSDLDGQSFLHHLTGDAGPEREWVYCHYIPWGIDNDPFGNTRMVYGKRYKLYRDGRVYDMVDDIFEKTPLPEDDPVVANIRAQYQPIFDSRPTWESSVARMTGERFTRGSSTFPC